MNGKDKNGGTRNSGESKGINRRVTSRDAETRVLYWVDIPQATIFIYHPDSGLNENIDLSDRFQTIGTLAPIKNGGLLFTPDRKIARLDLANREVTILAEVEPDLPGNRFNDGKCDPAGRFLAGTMKQTPDGEAAGSLYSFDPHTGVRKLLDGLQIPNGLGWSPDYRQFYLGDSMSRDVWVFDYDLETGQYFKPAGGLYFAARYRRRRWTDNRSGRYGLAGIMGRCQYHPLEPVYQ